MKNGVPLIDGKQDYDLLGSSEGNNVTILKFKRKLVTCDKEDRDIKVRLYTCSLDVKLKFSFHRRV